MVDSRPETRKHIAQVALFLLRAVEELGDRARDHDASKLESPEVEVLDRETPILAGLTYGSPEYAACLARMRPMLDHHYAVNRHHPEHFGADGMRGMSLLDLLEMICDWMAAARRHTDGDVRRSIEINQKRFGYGDDLKAILLNTVGCLEV
jgi:hypothetical protein